MYNDILKMNNKYMKISKILCTMKINTLVNKTNKISALKKYLDMHKKHFNDTCTNFSNF